MRWNRPLQTAEQYSRILDSVVANIEDWRGVLTEEMNCRTTSWSESHNGDEDTSSLTILQNNYVLARIGLSLRRWENIENYLTVMRDDLTQYCALELKERYGEEMRPDEEKVLERLADRLDRYADRAERLAIRDDPRNDMILILWFPTGTGHAGVAQFRVAVHSLDDDDGDESDSQDE